MRGAGMICETFQPCLGAFPPTTDQRTQLDVLFLSTLWYDFTHRDHNSRHGVGVGDKTGQFACIFITLSVCGLRLGTMAFLSLVSAELQPVLYSLLCCQNGLSDDKLRLR